MDLRRKTCAVASLVAGISLVFEAWLWFPDYFAKKGWLGGAFICIAIAYLVPRFWGVEAYLNGTVAPTSPRWIKVSGDLLAVTFVLAGIFGLFPWYA